MSAVRRKADIEPPVHDLSLAQIAAGVCENHDLCTECLTHMECGFMLCILYVRNGERYGGLWIRAGEHRGSILVRPNSRAQSREMRQDISGEDQWCSVGPQAANAP